MTSKAISDAEKARIRDEKEREYAETKKKQEAFREMQKWPYIMKLQHAEMRASQFYRTITGEYLSNVHVSVGGLDSITLYLFLKKYVYADIKGVSVSALEDKSIQRVHKELGIISVKPEKSKVEVIREYGYPVISKDIAGKMDMLQNPTERNATVRHAILTGETGELGGYRYSERMRMPQKWRELFIEQEAPFKVSAKCCYYLKEKPCDIWAKQHISYPYLGLMASEGGRRSRLLPINGCNMITKSTKRSCPFAIFTRQDLLQLALDLQVPVPEIYGEIRRDLDGNLYTTKAQRTGCSMCGFGIHMDKRPHHFDLLREENPKEWRFWMYDQGWGRVLTYIGVGWEEPYYRQVEIREVMEAAP